jgi:SNF2 family DNA or RNA helicase
MRSVLRKWVRQTGALQFLESVRLVQLSTDIPSCNACESQPDALASISVLGSCGHVLCQGCTSVATHSEECAVDGCIASAKEFGIINGQEIGRWKGAAGPKGQSQRSQYGGSKIDKLVEVIQGTPEEDRVLLFIQFPDLVEMACMALEVAGIKHQRVTASKHALFQQDEKPIAELNQHKVLILNLGTDTAAGL